VTANDFFDRFLLPCERFGYLAHGEASDVELRRGRSPQIVEMKIPLRHSGVDLGLVDELPNPSAVHGRCLLLVSIVVARFGNACRRGGEDHDRNSSQGNDPILWAQRDSSVTDEVGQRGLVVDVQLRIRLTQIMTNGRGCQAGQARDVLVRFPFGVQSHRLEFSRRESIEWRCFAQLDESQQPGRRAAHCPGAATDPSAWRGARPFDRLSKDQRQKRPPPRRPVVIYGSRKSILVLNRLSLAVDERPIDLRSSGVAARAQTLTEI
jgi:hypothetical protein